MTKQKFIKVFGEDPVDVLGQDWQNKIYPYEDWISPKYKDISNRILVEIIKDIKKREQEYKQGQAETDIRRHFDEGYEIEKELHIDYEN